MAIPEKTSYKGMLVEDPLITGTGSRLLDIIKPFWEAGESGDTFDEWLKDWGMYFEDYDPYREGVKRQQFTYTKEELRDPYEADILSAGQKLARGGLRGGYMHEEILGDNVLQDRINSMALSTQSAIKSLEEAWEERTYSMIMGITQGGAFEKPYVEPEDPGNPSIWGHVFPESLGGERGWFGTSGDSGDDG